MKKTTKPAPRAPSKANGEPPMPVAVLDIGTSSIRMAIAEIGPGTAIRRLDSLRQSVGLGKDTFTKGFIERATIEECVRALASFRDMLCEYGITRREQIRAVATSAVREASNRDEFVDRVYIATGIDIDVIDLAEANRLTYLGVEPVVTSDSRLAEARNLVVEAGGGSTELLVLHRGLVTFSYTAALGSLRMREMIEGFRAPLNRQRALMEQQVGRTVDQMFQSMPKEPIPHLIALGGDAGFTASQLAGRPERRGGLVRLPLKGVEALTDRVLALTVDDVVRTFHLTYPEAETLGPALLVYIALARALKVRHILVSGATMRDGLLMEVATRGLWTPEFREQIVGSAHALGEKCHWDEAHSTQVAELAGDLYRALQRVHGLDPRYEFLLHIAALLHEIGLFVNNQNHHKHSMYLIENSELFGLGRRDLLLVALVARYHRGAEPRPNHLGFSQLERDDRIAVTKLAAILRVADALDRGHRRRVRRVRCRVQDGRFVVTVPRLSDLSLEELALREKGGLFDQVFGLEVVLRKGGETPGR